MKKATIYHNPRCSKSRMALQILNDKQVETKVVEYLKNPLSKQQIQFILTKLGLTPRDILRTSEGPYKSLGLNNPQLSDEELLIAITTYPVLLERPIIVTHDKAVVARPPEKLLEII